MHARTLHSLNSAHQALPGTSARAGSAHHSRCRPCLRAGPRSVSHWRAYGSKEDLGSADSRDTSSAPSSSGRTDSTSSASDRTNDYDSNTRPPTSQRKGSSEGRASASSSKGGKQGSEEEGAIDAVLAQTWDSLKKQLRKDLPREQAEMVERMSWEDVMDTKGTIRTLAAESIGPVLESLGIEGDPLDVFTDIVKTAVALQLGIAAVLFWGYEAGLHVDAGAASIATGALMLGYLLRIFISIDQLAWPLYDGILKLFVDPSLPPLAYDLSSARSSDRQSTLNKLAVVVAVAFLVPRYLLGWDSGEAFTLLVAPICGGMLVFDLAYMAAVILEVKSAGRSDK